MIQFKLKTTPGFNPAVRFTQRKPRDKGIRMVVLSNQELNPEQENFCLDKDGETIAITFRNPRAHAWLRDDEVREKKINWPFFSLCFEEISKSIQIRLQFKWRKETFVLTI
ncbi:unnamed protein product, partial [Mesorhabditis belari]|uniref:Uncharacterized protein n=1 Tax=Mesorhabditis belari TaxID=2138241 RepID=A0AAF3F5C7_9BILA